MDPSQKKQDDELLQLVTFSIGEEEFGVNILKVQEIIRTMEITKVPRAPEFVEGVINLRGKVIPIIDLRRRFGLAPKAHDKNTRIIVIEINNIIVGFVVDAVSEVLRIPASTVEPPPPVVAGVDSDYISGVGKLQDRLLIMLDLDKLLSSEDMDAPCNGAHPRSAIRRASWSISSCMFLKTDRPEWLVRLSRQNILRQRVAH